MTDMPREIIEEAQKIAADIASSSNYSVGVIADALLSRDKRAAAIVRACVPSLRKRGVENVAGLLEALADGIETYDTASKEKWDG